jgi:hypothetical protein
MERAGTDIIDGHYCGGVAVAGTDGAVGRRIRAERAELVHLGRTAGTERAGGAAVDQADTPHLPGTRHRQR